MLRIPTVSEVIALFFTSKSVDKAVAAISRSAAALDAVRVQHLADLDRHSIARNDALKEAARLAVKISESAAEADRAVRVAGRLKELLD